MKRITQGILALLIGFALISSTACTRILLRMYGYRKPKPENRYELNKALLKYRVDTLNSFLVKVDTSNGQLNFSIGMGHYTLYDHKGCLIWPPDEKECYAPEYIYLKTYDRDHHTVYDEAKNLDHCFAAIRNIDGSDVQRDSTWNDDVYCIAGWAKFTGSLNKQLYVSDTSFKAMKNLKIRMIKVNEDLLGDEFDRYNSIGIQVKERKKKTKRKK